MADIASVALKYTADTSGYISSLRGAAAANRDFGSSLDTSTKADRFRVPDMSAMTAPLNETVRLLREISAIQMQGLSAEKQVAIARQLQAEETNRMATAQRAMSGTGSAGVVGQINAETSAIARQLEKRKEAAALRVAQDMANRRSVLIAIEESRALTEREAEEKKRIAAQTNAYLRQLSDNQAARDEAQADQRIATAAKIAAINARTSAVSGGSRFDNANPFEQQVMLTQKLNALLEKRKTITDEVERAENRLAIAQQVAAVRAARADLTAGTPINRLRNLGSTAEDSQEKMRKFNLVMTQGGYQMQDFAVQVAGGQSALVALSQQGSQMLGFFGPGGAIAGAALAVGVLAAQFYNASEAAQTQISALDKLQERIKGMQQGKRDFVFSGKDDAGKIQQLAQERATAEEKYAKARQQWSSAAQTPGANFADKPMIQGLLAGYNTLVLWTMGMTNAQIASEKFASAEEARASAMELVAKARLEEESARRAYDQERIRAYTEQFEENQKIGQSDQARISAIYDQMDALAAMGNTGTLAFAKLEGEAMKLESAINASRNAESKAAYDRTKAYTDQLEANKDLFRTDKERLAIMDAQLKAMADMGEVGTLDFAKLEGDANRLSKQITDKSAQVLLGLQSRIPQALSVRGGGQSTGGFVGSTQNSAQTSIKLLQDMLSTLQRIAVGVN